MKKINLSEPSIEGNEWKYVKECLDTSWVSTAGKYVSIFENKISQYVNCKYAISCVNGTSALQLSLKILNVSFDDEVIVPSLTFIATVNAIIYNNASPVFMDSDEYFNIDSQKTIDFLKEETFFKNGFTFNKKTKKKIAAIIPVHIWGNAVELDDLIKECKKRNIAVLEDASESLGTFYISGKYKGKSTGTIGDMGCLSFNGNKIITSGGGGMILTDNEKFASKARYLSTQAKDDKLRYIHNEVGYNFRLTNIQAALGLAQLELLPKFLDRKKEINCFYEKKIKNIIGLKIYQNPKYALNNYWLNVLKVNGLKYGEKIQDLMNRLISHGIQIRPIWYLNHLQKPFINFQSYKIEKAIRLVSNSICLPSSSGLLDEEINFIISKLRKINDR